MILYKYVFKEIFKLQIVTLLILAAIFICQSLIKFLGRASSGNIPAEIVSQLVAYSLPSMGFIMLPMTLYLAILVAVGRLSSDSEMVVMKSVGMSGASFMKIALTLTVLTAAFTAFNNLYLMPKSVYEQRVLMKNSQSNPEYLPIESGRFTNFGNYTVYIQDVMRESADGKEMSKVYIMQDPFNRINSAITIANSGTVSVDDTGLKWLNLHQGVTYEGPLADGTLRKVIFKTFSVHLPDEGSQNPEDDSVQGVATVDLIKSGVDSYKIELQWRFAPILACFILTMVAVPLSMVNPRQGRFTRLGPALLLYISYYMGLLSVRNMLNSGHFPLWPGLYVVPLVFLIFVVIPLNLNKNTLRKIKS